MAAHRQNLAFVLAMGILSRRMPRELTTGSRQEILQISARLFREQGYDATSMNDISAALKLSKGGLYHHFRSKDEILFHIMNHAMEITEQRVLAPLREVSDPEERLRMLIRLHICLLYTSPSPRDMRRSRMPSSA